MRTPRRLVTGAGLLAGAAVLTACQKPLPAVTVLSGTDTTVVAPQTYCFDLQTCRTPNSAVASITAAAGARLLVDVPRSVAHSAWTVRSAVRQGDGTFRTIAGAGYASGTVSDRHTTSVRVPVGVGTYYLVVTQRGADAAGSWIAEVTISS